VTNRIPRLHDIDHKPVKQTAQQNKGLQWSRKCRAGSLRSVDFYSRPTESRRYSASNVSTCERILKESANRTNLNIPIYAAARSLSRGKLAEAKRHLAHGFVNEYADRHFGDDGKFTDLGVLNAIRYPLDRHFKDSMIRAFQSGNATLGLKQSEIRLLSALQLIDQNSVLTTYGRNRTIEFLPLAAQCDTLQIPLTTHDLDRNSKRVEDDAAEQLKREFEHITTCESGPFMVIFYCIAVTCLRKLAVADDGFSALLQKKFSAVSIFSPAPKFEIEGCQVELPWHDEERLTDEFLKTATKIDSSDVVTCLENEYNGSYPQEEYPSLTPAKVLNLFRALSSNQVMELASFFVKSPYQNRNGWPDVVFFKDSNVRLVQRQTLILG